MRRANAATMPARLKRCAIYTRKSTTAGLEQEFNTLDAQREACEAYVRSQTGAGWIALEQRYDDGGFTGANIDRPAFQRLLTDVDSGLVDTIIVYKLDRISRSLLDFATVMNRLTKVGVGFVSVTQNFSTNDAVGRMTLNLLATFAEFEREQIGERTRDKMAASRRRGRWTGGQVPIGYEVVDKKLVVVESEAETVREIFSLYLQERSALSVALILNEQGRKTKGHLASTGRFRQPREWGKGDVLQVLKMPLYAGYMRCGRELYDGEHDAVVDRLTFERAKALLLLRPVRRRPHRRNPEYLLSGIVKCALCGCSLTAASAQKGKREYRYYRCTTRDRKGRKACRTKPMSAPLIEKYVSERLREATEHSALVEEANRAVQRLAAIKTEQIVRAGKLAEELAQASGSMVVEPSGLSGKESVAHLHSLERSLADTERMVMETEHDLAKTTWIASCLRDFGEVWDVLSPVNRGRLLRAVVERVDLDDASGEVRIELMQFPEARS